MNSKYLPVTMEQFQELTNEMLVRMNVLNAPHFFDADYIAQILMSSIHSLPKTKAKLTEEVKEEIFENMVNRVSQHVTWAAVEEIQKRLKAAAGLSVVDPDGDQSAHAEKTH